jgi:hypothetical protein
LKKLALAAVVAAFLTACASSHAIDMSEPRRVLGTADGVRVDALVHGDQIVPGARVPITWEITNQRSSSIAIADLIPETSYDDEASMFTVTIGSEVPGNELLPRLVEIAPGEKKAFSGTASLKFILPPRAPDPLRPPPSAELRLKINFLGETAPFRQLIGIAETAIADKALADALFPLWLEHNEALYTNSLPMRWTSRRGEPLAPPRRTRGGV